MVFSGARTYLHAFLILAVILAGISPACKFISGQMSVMEICGFDGIKRVVVDSSQTPDQQEHKQIAQDDCAFCFAQANFKAPGASTPPSLVTIQAPSETASFALATFTSHTITHPFDARGPPILS